MTPQPRTRVSTPGAFGLARRLLVAAAVALLAAVYPATAQAQRLELSINPQFIAFAAGDPDTVPFMTTGQIEITYRIRNNNGPWTLTVLAAGDLISGASKVDISNVTWVATPAPPFQNGTMSKTVAQRMASGTGNINPSRQAQVTFRLANSWNYNAGLYFQTMVFTLTAP